MSEQKPDPYPHMSRKEIDRITGGGLLRVIPIVKLWDMLRGKSRPTQFTEERRDEDQRG